jgi:FkbM family methyltransferase
MTTTANMLLPPLEGELLSRIITKDMIVLDIGANQGAYTIFLSKLARHVTAFEPEPNNFNLLKKHTNLFKNVKVHNVAISDRMGFAYLHLCPTDNGMHRLYPSKWCEGGPVEEVYTWTIDDFMVYKLPSYITTYPHNTIGFVKIDVEGYEYQVIQGMTNLIQRDHPIIVMEWHPPSLEEAGTNPEELYLHMKEDFGYGNPKHCYLQGYPTINSYQELNNYTRDIPAINILWQ